MKSPISELLSPRHHFIPDNKPLNEGRNSKRDAGENYDDSIGLSNYEDYKENYDYDYDSISQRSKSVRDSEDRKRREWTKRHPLFAILSEVLENKRANFLKKKNYELSGNRKDREKGDNSDTSNWLLDQLRKRNKDRGYNYQLNRRTKAEDLNEKNRKTQGYQSSRLKSFANEPVFKIPVQMSQWKDSNQVKSDVRNPPAARSSLLKSNKLHDPDGEAWDVDVADEESDEAPPPQEWDYVQQGIRHGGSSKKLSTDYAHVEGKNPNHVPVSSKSHTADHENPHQKITDDEANSKIQQDQNEINSKFQEDQNEPNSKYQEDQDEINSKFQEDQKEMNSKFQEDQKEINSKFQEDQKEPNLKSHPNQNAAPNSQTASQEDVKEILDAGKHTFDSIMKQNEKLDGIQNIPSSNNEIASLKKKISNTDVDNDKKSLTLETLDITFNKESAPKDLEEELEANLSPLEDGHPSTIAPNVVYDALKDTIKRERSFSLFLMILMSLVGIFAMLWFFLWQHRKSERNKAQTESVQKKPPPIEKKDVQKLPPWWKRICCPCSRANRQENNASVLARFTSYVAVVKSVLNKEKPEPPPNLKDTYSTKNHKKKLKSFVTEQKK